MEVISDVFISFKVMFIRCKAKHDHDTINRPREAK